MGKNDGEDQQKTPAGRRVSRQREAGEVTRRETRRRLLVAARQEFAERGYAAATVNRIAARADVSVQTLYSAWGSKRSLLRAMMETAVTGQDDPDFEMQGLPAVLVGDLDPADAGDPRKVLGFLAHQFRLIGQRASTAWKTYRDAAAVDPDIAADWQQLMEVRRTNFTALVDHLAPDRLRPGLTPAAAVDTAWVIASPEVHDLLVNSAGYTYDELETWVHTTLCAVLLGD